MRILRPAREEDVAVLIEIARRAWLSAFSQSVPFALVAAWVQADRATRANTAPARARGSSARGRTWSSLPATRSRG